MAYQANGLGRGRGRGMPLGRGFPMYPPPPPYAHPLGPPHLLGGAAALNGEQVNLGHLPKFRKLSDAADLEERLDWIDHMFSKLDTAGPQIF